MGRYLRFDTPADVVPRERFDYWRSWHSRAMGTAMRLEPVAAVPRDFGSSVQVLRVGGISVSELHCGPAAGHWQREDMEANDLLRIGTLCRPVPVTAQWHEHDVAMAAGSPRPLLLARTAGWWHAPAGLHAIQVNVPRAAVPVEDAVLERVTDRPLPTDVVFASLVRPMLVGTAGRLAELGAGATDDLATVWLSAVTMLVRSLTAEGDLGDGAELTPARRLAAARFIAAHLSDPRLSPEMIAGHLAVSRRSLYALFAGEGDGVAGVIRRQRLERARQLLLDPRQRHRPVAEIAVEVGLPSAAHFSRLFRAEYGVPPREMRGAGGTGTREGPDHRRPRQAEAR